MLFPKKVKYRKWHRMRQNPKKIGIATRGVNITYGSYGLKAVTYARINSRQIEATRRVIKRTIGKTGKMWTRVFPDRPYTAKPAEMGMGHGKGDIQGYEFEVLPGRILFEVDGVNEEIAREAFRKAGKKLPVKVKFVERY